MAQEKLQENKLYISTPSGEGAGCKRKGVSRLFSLRDRNKKAFNRHGAEGSLHDGVYTREARGRAKVLPLVFPNFPRETIKEPLFSISSLERSIHNLAECGERKALRAALLEYLKLWGVQC